MQNCIKIDPEYSKLKELYFFINVKVPQSSIYILRTEPIKKKKRKKRNLYLYASRIEGHLWIPQSHTYK